MGRTEDTEKSVGWFNRHLRRQSLIQFMTFMAVRSSQNMSGTEKKFQSQAQKHSTSYLLFMDIYGRFGKNTGQPLLHSSFLIEKTWLPSDCARETSAACPGMGQKIRRDYPLANCYIAMDNGHRKFVDLPNKNGDFPKQNVSLPEFLPVCQGV